MKMPKNSFFFSLWNSATNTVATQYVQAPQTSILTGVHFGTAADAAGSYIQVGFNALPQVATVTQDQLAVNRFIAMVYPGGSNFSSGIYIPLRIPVLQNQKVYVHWVGVVNTASGGVVLYFEGAE